MPTYTALVNPISGGGHALSIWTPIAQSLAAQGIRVTVETTRSAAHAVEAAATAAARGDTVIAVGGDGLARDVANGVTGTGAAMAIVPAGRGNDFARKLALPTDPAGLTAMLATGVTRTIDVIEAAGQTVLGNVYVGLDSVANEAINNNRWLPGLLVYRLAPVSAMLRWKAPIFTLDVDGASTSARLHGVVIANSGRYGHGLDIVPSAELHDGQLDVLTIADGPRHKIVKFMSQAKTGAHVHSDDVTVTRTTQITVAADRAVPVYADGDHLGPLPMSVTIRAAALEIVVP
ncbi:MAG TPA: diacylglycerol kinase family protein [Jatrophihabitans sp.]|jgi:YegS/Rv2252/BmrU family lipid kinase|uniref:diacylglycerol/lipid kinase family protein n=1 Tax=Jatrophihabitans sp. TaxID=1932789 RepID=UPI002DFBFA7D|nr:diacylglycerol kinase family protein [Jatrophihabitans sp.]